MEISKAKLNELTKRMYMSRLRVLMRYPFFGLLLMHAKYGLDADYCDTAYTDGNRIMFNPTFLDSLVDHEVDFIMMHEVMHIALRHCFRGIDYDHELFNIACDTVVNSNIQYSCGLADSELFLFSDPDPYRFTPNGDDGYKYTAEEVYEMLQKEESKSNKGNKSSSGNNNLPSKNGKGTTDDHGKWTRQPNDEDGYDDKKWERIVKDAAEAIKGRIDRQPGDIPMCIERELKELGTAKHDWRTILNNFIQEEVCDYSFTPPDRRYDGDFFLPDFNGTDISVKDILFMIDTSGSMEDQMITDMYSEIKGAIDQFDGKLTGKLGFFDADVVTPQPFKSVEEFKIIQPIGGGGTSFEAVFNYVNSLSYGERPTMLIMLTDGYAYYPPDNPISDIPILWVINNEESKPPYGKVLRI